MHMEPIQSYAGPLERPSKDVVKLLLQEFPEVAADETESFEKVKAKLTKELKHEAFPFPSR